MPVSLIPESQWARLRKWHDLNGRHELPWRRTRDPWQVFTAEFLLARTHAHAVAKVYPEITLRFTGPEGVLSGTSDWNKLTSSLGLQSRLERFTGACEILISRYNSKVPSGRGELLELPGVGHYITAAVRNFAFDIPEVIVDTNTIRLANRISGVPVDKSGHKSKIARSQVGLLGRNPLGQSQVRNYALLDLAALVCTPSNPDCLNCPIYRCCAAKSDGFSGNN